MNKLHSLNITCWWALSPGSHQQSHPQLLRDHSSTNGCWLLMPTEQCWRPGLASWPENLQFFTNISHGTKEQSLTTICFSFRLTTWWNLQKREINLITVILISPARSPVYWKEIYAISTVSKTSKNSLKKSPLITPWETKRNTMPILQLNSVQTWLCCYISPSITKPKKHF